jgi:hypothetical protein
MQRYTVYLYLETALHVSGGTCTHHQERIQLYLQHLVFVTPCHLSHLTLSWKSLNRFECAVSGVRAPDDECKYHPKHVEQFPDINKLCNVASFWIYTYIGIYLRCTDP